MMGFISWIILGLVAGALARWIMPGEDKMGWVMTMILGIAGAFFGGFIGKVIGLGASGGFDFYTLITATVGAFVLLFAYNRFVR